MSETEHEVEGYLRQIVFPVTKEELINGLLAGEAPGRMIVLVERLPRARYDDLSRVRRDLEEIDRVDAREVVGARTYDALLASVLRNVGDIRYATKATYNRVVERVVHLARQHGTLSDTEAHRLRQQLEAAFADLRGTMPEVYDAGAPIDPREDLPRTRK